MYPELCVNCRLCYESIQPSSSAVESGAGGSGAVACPGLVPVLADACRRWPP